MLVCSIALLSPPYTTLQYILPTWLPQQEWKHGLRVLVPLGKSMLRVGVVLAVVDITAENIQEDITLKPVFWPIEHTPVLPELYLKLLQVLAVRQATTVGYLLGTLVPVGLRTSQVHYRLFENNGSVFLKPKELRAFSEERLQELGLQWQAGSMLCLDKEQDPNALVMCILAKDPPWPIRPNSKKLLAVLEVLFEEGSQTLTALQYTLGISVKTSVANLVQRGLVRLEDVLATVAAVENSISVKQCPIDMNQTPVTANQCLVDVKQCLVDVKQVPIDVKQSCISVKQCPIDMNQASVTVKQCPIGMEEIPEPKKNLEREESLLESCSLNEPAPDEPTLELNELFNDSYQNIQFTAEQQQSITVLQQALHAPVASSHLLFGITGSGKTAVYLELVRQCLESGRSALLLAPEVALACKLRREAEHMLTDVPLFFYHGYQSPVIREKLFKSIAQSDKPALVIGTRSALFLPTQNLGLVIMDEEHDGSFKQDEGTGYQAKEVAWYLSQQWNALLLLGSATPDIKTFYATVNGQLPVATLKNRVGGGQLPMVELIDIKSTQATEGILAKTSMDALQETVKKGEQAVILLNRRGYAPTMYCLQCGVPAKCPHCNISLTYHKKRERLLCHYCGYTTSFPAICTSCKSSHFLPMGEGTEKLEETLQHILPEGSKVLRLDRDSTRRTGRMEEILLAFANQEAQVLVGTQMLSKGHHFPNVTLAIIADADTGLNLPDYRAAERTFQLIVQSSGRAGRGIKAGRVLIQTRDLSHYCWEHVKDADYQGFYEKEIVLRERRHYPPFVKLALVRISFAMGTPVGTQLENVCGLAQKQAKELGVRFLGPAPAPIPVLRGRLRYNCLLKGADWALLRQVYTFMQQRKTSTMRISLDIDPISML